MKKLDISANFELRKKTVQIAIIGNQYFKLEKQKQILQIDEITTCLTTSNVPPYKSLQWVRLSKTIIGVVDTKNVNSIGINEGVI